MPRKNNPAPASAQKTAVLYARVSTRDQEEQGHSLPAQVAKLQDYAQKYGFQVIRTFSFQETGGQKRQRHKFMEMLAYLKQFDAATMPALLCNNVDRITRNFKDHAEIDDMRLTQGLHVHFVQDGLVITPTSSGNDLFQWDAKAFLAKQYLHRVKDDAVRSAEYKLKNGQWPHNAPLGYRNTKDDAGRSHIMLDAERAPLVRRMFVEYAKGTLSVNALTGIANGWGLRNKTKRNSLIAVSQVHKLLTNPFYYGQMLEQGTLYPHSYSPLIDKPTWDKCQAVLNGYNKQPFAYAAKPFTFRGMIICAHCGSAYTTEQKKGKYNYLFCTKNKNPHCPAPRLKEDVVFAQAAAVLDMIAIPEQVLAEVKQHLVASHQAKNEFHNLAFKNLTGQLVQVKKKQQRLWDLYLSAEAGQTASITPNDLDKMLTGLKQEETDLERQLANHKDADADYYISLNLLLELVQNAGRLFHSADVEQKRKILKLVYWNLQLDGATLRYSLRKPFDVFANSSTSQTWLGRKDSNPRMSGPKPDALPLGDSPAGVNLL
jgi:site-specific DNA recombinase